MKLELKILRYQSIIELDVALVHASREGFELKAVVQENISAYWRAYLQRPERDEEPES